MTQTIIIGGGLTGLFLAHRLHGGGHNVTLLEANESLGGRYRRPNQAMPYSSPGLDFIPANPEQMALLEWLRNLSPIPLSFAIYEHQPLVFMDGKWKTFAGFGDVGFQSVGELSANFSHTQGVTLTPGLEHLTRALVEQLPIEAQTMSQVTGLKLKEGKVVEVIVNGDKALRADNFIFTPHPIELNTLIEGEDLPVKHRTRLAKMQSWTSVTLELPHPAPLADTPALHFFFHGAKEFEPIVGRIFPAHSKWLTLVPGDREADHEFAGQCIRHIKRQLKRAWPQAFDPATAGPGASGQEKIFIQAHAYGQHSLRTKESFRFPEISNLYLANHALASVPGDLAALDTVRTLEKELCAASSNKLPELGASC